MLERLYTALHLSDMNLWALFDIAVLAVIIYQLLLVIRGTRAVNILVALAAVALLYVITGPGLISLNAVHSILGTLLFYLPLIVIVLFQNQIRQALAHLGKNPIDALMPRAADENMIEELALVAASLASKRLGALIVIERGMGLRTFAETGIALDARVSYDLLMNLFTRRAPLHDGAVIIAEGRIKAASCYLPLTTNPTLSRAYGTRHRAAIGISEESDALAIVVSEERGVVSLTEGGRISSDLDARGLQAALQRALGSGGDAAAERARGGHVVAAGPTDA